MLKWLLQRVLILTALVAVSFILPVASFWLLRDPIGAQVVFWASPWVVAFWSVIAYVLIGSRCWRGKLSVEEYNDRHGSYLWRSAKNTVWMFAALAFSYAAEFAVVFFVPPSATAMHLFPLATYSPLAFTILWSAARG
jgi:succinate dehydrogenase hydrophobic anchor subunit